MASSQSSHLSASRAVFLAQSNLLSIFGTRDPQARLAAMHKTYTSNIIVYEPSQAILRGFDQINSTISKLLQDNAGWEFEQVGEVKYNQDYVGVHWGFGPRAADGKVDAKVTGSDVIFVAKEGEGEEAKIRVLYVVLDGVADAVV